METLLPTLVLTLALLGVAVFGMAVRVFLKQDSFRGGCASNNPMLRDKVGACGVCGKTDFDDEDKSTEPKIITVELPKIG